MTKRFRIVWSEAALEDFEKIITYVLEDEGPPIASKLAVQIHDRIDKLDRLPARGRIVPELRAEGVEEYREVIEAPYRIMYRIRGRDVVLLAVLDGRRDLDELLIARALAAKT